MEKKIEVKCPTCKKNFSYYESMFRPFCREQCKMIDLGHWFDESYSVAGQSNSVYIEDGESLEEIMDDDENY